MDLTNGAKYGFEDGKKNRRNHLISLLHKHHDKNESLYKPVCVLFYEELKLAAAKGSLLLPEWCPKILQKTQTISTTTSVLNFHLLLVIDVSAIPTIHSVIVIITGEEGVLPITVHVL